MTRTISYNKKARFDYEILETIEAGIVLFGHEVKSVRQGNVSIKQAYAKIISGEVWLINAHISKWEHYTSQDYDPTRTRKLLLSRPQIDKLIGKIKEKGLTLLPLQIYVKNGKLVKVKLGIGRGKKLRDKREQIKARETNIMIEREFKGRNR